MRKTPNKEPMSVDEMALMQEEKRGSRIYKEVSAEHRREELSKLASRMRKELIEVEKIELTTISVSDLKRLVSDYLLACERSGTLPSILGLCRSMGYSRSALYKYLNTHAHTKNAEFLEIAKDTMAEMLDVAALQNLVNPIVSIFILKSIFERTDKAELLIRPLQPESPLGPPMTPEEEEALYAKYRAAIPEGDYEQ